MAPGLVTALAIGFLFASVGAVAGAASGLELSEGGLADGTGALCGGLAVCVIEFSEEMAVLNESLFGEESAQLLQFRKAKA